MLWDKAPYMLLKDGKDNEISRTVGEKKRGKTYIGKEE